MFCSTQGRLLLVQPVKGAEVLAEELAKDRAMSMEGLVYFESQWDLLNLVEVCDKRASTAEFHF